jgi:hypothetical protein
MVDINVNNVNSAWGAVRAVLKNTFPFYEIKDIVGLAGFDSTKISHLVQRPGGNVSKGQLITVIEQHLSDFTDNEKHHFLNLVVKEILERDSKIEGRLEKYLSRLGWQIIDASVIPISILDRGELEGLDEVCAKDLIKAAKRFRDGDLSGALSAACGAVDSMTSEIYQNKQLGDAGKASFQERCKVSLNNIGVFTAVENDLKDIKWKDSGIVPFNKNFKGALSQAAYVMQSLRGNMSDVHGTKPVLKPLVFDSIKWAQIIIRLLSERYSA